MTPLGRTFLIRFGSALVLALAIATGACTVSDPQPDRPPIPPPINNVAAAYPTLSEIYGGAQGIYRGCGPNGNVCHNSRQYPNMNTLGALALNVNQPCNQLQDDPTRIDDWCERQGDTVRVGGARLLLAYIQKLADATDTQGSRWAIAVQGDFPALTAQDDLSIVRVQTGAADQWLLGFQGTQITADPTRTNVVFVQVDAGDDTTETRLAQAGIPANREAIQFGDPNRNGVFGVGIGNRLIFAGHPERSYIIRRLTDPSAGPLMPLANCCFWSKDSLRALWCWIANLRPDGSNAMDPIDYTVCPDGPVENIQYPVPGPTCENGGLCPVHTRDAVPDDPTWANVYSNILVARCGGNGCHFSTPAAGALDFGTSDVAYEQLLHSMMPRVVPGNPSMSLMYQRLTQACAMGSTTCRRMPLFQPQLPDNELSVISRWIMNGAPHDGMLGDGGTMDAALPDASDVSAPDASDVSADTGAADTGTTDSGGTDTGTPMDAGMDAATDDGVDAAVDAGMDAG